MNVASNATSGVTPEWTNLFFFFNQSLRAIACEACFGKNRDEGIGLCIPIESGMIFFFLFLMFVT